MNPGRELGGCLVITDLVLAAVGAILSFGSRLPFRLGHLPGDIAIQGRRGSFYFPVVTCLLLSVFLTLVMWLIGWIRK